MAVAAACGNTAEVEKTRKAMVDAIECTPVLSQVASACKVAAGRPDEALETQNIMAIPGGDRIAVMGSAGQPLAGDP